MTRLASTRSGTTTPPGSPSGLAVDADILIIDLRFPRDPQHAPNAALLQVVRTLGGFLTLYTLIEILGNLSCNRSGATLLRLETQLQQAYNLTIVWPEPHASDPFEHFREERYLRPRTRMAQAGFGYVDVLTIDLVERHAGAATFVTWNARHFRDKTQLRVLTPAEYLTQAATGGL